MATRETPIEKAIRKAIKQKWPNAWILKVVGHPFQKSGVPDLIGVVEGEFFGWEVKDQKPGESKEHAYARTSPQQRLMKKEINRAGATAVTVLSADEAVAVVEQRLKEKSA